MHLVFGRGGGNKDNEILRRVIVVLPSEEYYIKYKYK
jgi:hypothetical protein